MHALTQHPSPLPSSPLEQAVIDATQKAFASLRTAASPDMQQVEEALKQLTTLKVSLQQPVSCMVSTGSACHCPMQMPGSCVLVSHCLTGDHTCLHQMLPSELAGKDKVWCTLSLFLQLHMPEQ